MLGLEVDISPQEVTRSSRPSLEPHQKRNLNVHPAVSLITRPNYSILFSKDICGSDILPPLLFLKQDNETNVSCQILLGSELTR